jgi:hypothetical protein
LIYSAVMVIAMIVPALLAQCFKYGHIVSLFEYLVIGQKVLTL